MIDGLMLLFSEKEQSSSRRGSASDESPRIASQPRRCGKKEESRFILRESKWRVIDRGTCIRNPGVGKCLVFCTVYFWS